MESRQPVHQLARLPTRRDQSVHLKANLDSTEEICLAFPVRFQAGAEIRETVNHSGNVTGSCRRRRTAICRAPVADGQRSNRSSGPDPREECCENPDAVRFLISLRRFRKAQWVAGFPRNVPPSDDWMGNLADPSPSQMPGGISPLRFDRKR